MARQRRVTATDVAREAGVSQTTVSYVLNDVPHQKIATETRQRIHAAVEKLGYTPSAAARTLRLGRSNVVLLLLADMPLGHTAAELVERFTEVLQEQGLSVIARIEEGGSSDASLWADLAPCSVVTLAPVRADRRARMEEAGIPVINAWRRGPEDDGHDILSHSQERVGQLQARHLASAGHQRLGYAAPANARLSDFCELRMRGVRQACAELGIAAPAIREVPLDAASATAAVRAWRAEGVTAVCAFNDEVAFALLAGLRAAAMSAPGDLAVIGVDDIPVAQFAEPSLTTVNHRMEVVAAKLAEAVFGRLQLPNKPEGPRGESAALVVRESA